MSGPQSARWHDSPSLNLGVVFLALTLFYWRLKVIEKRAKKDIEDAEKRAKKDITDSLASYAVRDWTAAERAVNLACSNVTTLDEFYAMLRKQLKINSGCEIKLYLIEAERRWVEARRKIDSTESLQAALLAVRRFEESSGLQYSGSGTDVLNVNYRTEILYHLSALSPDVSSLARHDVSTPLPTANLFLGAGTSSGTGTSRGRGRGKNQSLSSPSSLSSTDSASSTRSSSDQAKFREILMTRDENACVICTISGDVDENVQLEAAHIIPFRDAANIQLGDFGLLTIHDSCNGMLLCHNCHVLYDRNIIGVDEKGNVHVCGALRGSKIEKWELLQERKLTVNLAALPSMSLALKYRHTFYEATAASRQTKAMTHSFSCDVCMIYVARTQNIIDRHKNGEKCKKNQKLVKNSPVYLGQIKTPVKSEGSLYCGDG